MSAGPLDEPPFMLDGARVMSYAVLDVSAHAGEGSGVVVDGVALDLETVRRVVVAQNLVDDSVFVMHCNEEWQTVAAATYPDLDTAEASAAAAYGALAPEWVRFRELSEDEAREVATTRAFLKEIAADG